MKLIIYNLEEYLLLLATNIAFVKAIYKIKKCGSKSAFTKKLKGGFEV